MVRALSQFRYLSDRVSDSEIMPDLPRRGLRWRWHGNGRTDRGRRQRRQWRFGATGAFRLNKTWHDGCRLLGWWLHRRPFLAIATAARRPADRNNDAHADDEKRQEFALRLQPERKVRRPAHRFFLRRSEDPLRREGLRTRPLALLAYSQGHGGGLHIAHAVQDAVPRRTRHRETRANARGARDSNNTEGHAPPRTG
jgi:hypothetical protein